jgi:FAD/FMN-containing dehydrogenase
MLDLSHWFYHRRHLPWDLSVSYEKPEYALLDYHKKAGIAFYMPNLGAFYSTAYPSDVHVSTEKKITSGTPEIAWRIETPLGSIERARIWEVRRQVSFRVEERSPFLTREDVVVPIGRIADFCMELPHTGETHGLKI